MQGVAERGHFSGINTVFLDRDGVINEKMPEGRYVGSLSDFKILPGVVESIARLHRAGIRVIVVSNQRGIALGYYSGADVMAIHEELQAMVHQAGGHVDAFYFCPHDKNECDCRKPKVGMFEMSKREFPSIRAERSVMIGDSLSDMEFGVTAGMSTIFIRGSEHTRKTGADRAAMAAQRSCDSLVEAVDLILLDRDAVPTVSPNAMTK